MENNVKYFFRLLKENFKSFKKVDDSVIINFNIDNDLKIMTFNLRRDANGDGIHNWQYRREYVIQTIKEYQPDIICFQEVMPTMAKYLIHKLSRYYDNRGVEIFTNREMNKSNFIFGEGLFTMWRKDKFSFVDKKIEKLYDGRILNLRRFMDITLRYRETEIHVLNTHFCHINKECQRKSFKKIDEYVSKLNCDFYICGDFNADKTYKNTDIEIFMGKFSYNYKKQITDSTINSFGERTVHDIIDYVFSNQTVKDFNIITDSYEQCKFLSDHNPVIVYY